MNSELIKFFSVQRQIFGVCSCCGDIFRLSDAKVYLKEKPQPGWMDKLHKSEERLDKQEDKINTEEAQTREIAREKGRKAAMESTKKIDTIFTPNNYNADDAKVMFHPVDFLIFNGMKEKNNIDNFLSLLFSQYFFAKFFEQLLLLLCQITPNYQCYFFLSCH